MSRGKRSRASFLCTAALEQTPYAPLLFGSVHQLLHQDFWLVALALGYRIGWTFAQRLFLPMARFPFFFFISASLVLPELSCSVFVGMQQKTDCTPRPYLQDARERDSESLVSTVFFWPALLASSLVVGGVGGVCLQPKMWDMAEGTLCFVELYRVVCLPGR